MKKQQLIILWNALKAFDQQQVNSKFAYFVAKNKNLMEGEINSLQAAMTFPEDIQNMERERIQLASEFALKQANQPVIDPTGMPVIDPNKRAEYTEKIKELEVGKEELLAIRDEKSKEVEELLLTPLDDMQLHKIKIDNLPEKLPQATMDIFITFDLIMDQP